MRARKCGLIINIKRYLMMTESRYSFAEFRLNLFNAVIVKFEADSL